MGGLDSLPIQEGLGKKQGVFFFGWGGVGGWYTNAHNALCLPKEEILADKVQGFLVFFGKRVKGFKERNMVQNVREKSERT